MYHLNDTTASVKSLIYGHFPASVWVFSLTGQEWALGEACWSVISNCHPYNGDYNTPGATLNDPNCHCALKNSCWPSPHKVLSCTEGGQLWRCFKWLHNYVRRMAACHGVFSWFCKLFEAMRHFRPPQKHVSAAGHWQWHEIKAPFDPQPTSTALGLQAVQRLEVRGTARSRRQAGPKTHENGSVDRFPSTHKMDKKRRVVAQAASTRTSTLHLWCQRALCGNLGNARHLLVTLWNCMSDFRL